jgi:hypothetical protein
MMVIKNLRGYGNDYAITPSGIITNRQGMTLPLKLGKTGYMFVSLIRDKKPIEKRVDKLVAYNFIGNKDPKRYNCIIHLDGNKTNNHFSNLKWSSKKALTFYRGYLQRWQEKASLKTSTKGLVVFDIHNNKENIYESPKAASLALGISASKIRKSARKKLKIGNYTFKYST